MKQIQVQNTAYNIMSRKQTTTYCSKSQAIKIQSKTNQNNSEHTRSLQPTSSQFSKNQIIQTQYIKLQIRKNHQKTRKERSIQPIPTKKREVQFRREKINKFNPKTQHTTQSQPSSINSVHPKSKQSIQDNCKTFQSNIFHINQLKSKPKSNQTKKGQHRKAKSKSNQKNTFKIKL